jgi:hypothetical protein
MRRLFEQGFGIIGGAFGTKLGATAGLGIVTVLGLGPLGLFVAVFVCASIGGIAGMNIAKGVGGKIYDYYEPMFDTGRIYSSAEQVFLEAVK